MQAPWSVVVVEDDAQVRAALASAVLRCADLRLAGAASGVADGMALLQRVQPDVALVDLGLPDGSGLGVIRAAVALARRCEVIVVSTLGDEAHVLAAIEAGTAGYSFDEIAQRMEGSRHTVGTYVRRSYKKLHAAQHRAAMPGRAQPQLQQVFARAQPVGRHIDPQRLAAQLQLGGRPAGLVGWHRLGQQPAVQIDTQRGLEAQAQRPGRAGGIAPPERQIHPSGGLRDGAHAQRQGQPVRPPAAPVTAAAASGPESPAEAHGAAAAP